MSKFMYAVANEFTFNKQTIGRIVLRITSEGKLEMSHNGGDFAPLGPTAVEYMLGFGFQRLRNTYQTMTDASIEERTAALDKAIAAVFDGTCGTGGGASARSAHDQAVFDVVSTILAKSAKAKAFKDAKAAVKSKMIEAVIIKNADNQALLDAITEREAVIERERKEAAELKKAASGLDLDI